MVYDPAAKVSCKYGAPMGRFSHGAAFNPWERLHCAAIPLNSGGYDSGGAYWGHGGRLYCVHDDSGEVSQYYRAVDREDAKAQFRDDYGPAWFHGEPDPYGEVLWEVLLLDNTGARVWGGDKGEFSKRKALQVAREFKAAHGRDWTLVEPDCLPCSAERNPPRWLTDSGEVSFASGECRAVSLHIPDGVSGASAMRIARLVNCYGAK